MTARRAVSLLLTVSCVALVIAAGQWITLLRGRSGVAFATGVALAAPPEVVAPIPDAIDSLATAVSDHDPFRLTREPSSMAYTPTADGAPPPPPPPPKPPIAVSGIIGPPWVAVLEGVPAHDGSMLARVGDTVSRAPYALLTIRAIRHDTVVVRAADTTWTLTVRHPWR